MSRNIKPEPEVDWPRPPSLTQSGFGFSLDETWMARFGYIQNESSVLDWNLVAKETQFEMSQVR